MWTRIEYFNQKVSLDICVNYSENSRMHFKHTKTKTFITQYHDLPKIPKK